MKIYTIGHLKPDLDSVVAAISFAKYFEQKNNSEVTPTITDEINPETQFVFSKFNQITPSKIDPSSITPEDKFILVDHNEQDQRLSSINPDQIIAVFDHHKANINFNQPIEIVIKPFGSSNTLAWQLFKQNNLDIDKELAQLMLSAILSDTVGLKSSTSTPTDKDAVTDLSIIAQEADIDSLSFEIFKAKSDISSLTNDQIVTNDYKIFEFGNKKVFIGQIETVEQSDLISNHINDLLESLSKIKKEQTIDLIYLAVTDILQINTKLIVLGDQEKLIAEKAFSGTTRNNILDIGSRLSRKKDIAPAIESAIIS